MVKEAELMPQKKGGSSKLLRSFVSKSLIDSAVEDSSSHDSSLVSTVMVIDETPNAGLSRREAVGFVPLVLP